MMLSDTDRIMLLLARVNFLTVELSKKDRQLRQLEFINELNISRVAALQQALSARDQNGN
jgi:hypothetical protein